MNRATQRQTACEGTRVEGCSLIINVREDEHEPGGFVAAACCADALVWETVEEHRFTFGAEAPGCLRCRCLRYIVREDVEVGRGGFMSTACCTDTLVWETVEEHRFTLVAEAPGCLRCRCLRYIVRDDEVEPGGFVAASCCT